MPTNEPDTTNPKADNAANEDYYLSDDGKIIFTAAYHLKRGYCCGNNCKHCPFGAPIPDLKK